MKALPFIAVILILVLMAVICNTMFPENSGSEDPAAVTEKPSIYERGIQVYCWSLGGQPSPNCPTPTPITP